MVAASPPSSAAGSDPAGQATRLLIRLEQGDLEASEELFGLLYQELRRIADGFMRRERADHTLQPTALAWVSDVALNGSSLFTYLRRVPARVGT